MNTPPPIDSSTREERITYVRSQWNCMNNCELCGKCHFLKGKYAELLYADYINGTRSYLDITLQLRRQK